MRRKKTTLLRNGKTSVPGQQIGLYSKMEGKDVRQMVRTLNPSEQSMDGRG